MNYVGEECECPTTKQKVVNLRVAIRQQIYIFFSNCLSIVNRQIINIYVAGSCNGSRWSNGLED